MDVVGELGDEREQSQLSADMGAKKQVSLRLDPAIIEGFRKTGPGWQGRMNEVLREWLARQAA